MTDGRQVSEQLVLDTGTRRALRSEVLRWYAGLPPRAVADPVADPARDYIIDIGGADRSASRQLAEQTGRTWRTAPSWDAAIGVAREARLRSVLVAADDRLLHAGELVPALARLHEIRCQAGVMGGDAAHLRFMARKIMASTRARFEADAYIDGVGYAVEVFGPGETTPPIEHDPEQLTGIDAGVLYVTAHGSGHHIHLGGVVICGGSHSEDRDPGALCDRERCRQTSAATVRRWHAARLRAQTVVLMCCNAFSLGFEQAPTADSVVRAFASGYASSVLALLNSAPVPDHMIDPLRSACEGGLTLGELALELNDVMYGQWLQPSVALYGDPLARVATAPAGRLAEPRNWDMPPWPAGVPPRARRPPPPVPGDRMSAIGAACPAAGIFAGELARLLEENGLPRDRERRGAIDNLAALSAAAEAACDGGDHDRVFELSGQWSEQLLSLGTEAVRAPIPSPHFHDALMAAGKLVAARVEGTCPHCETPLVVREYDEPHGAIRRMSRRCPRCGPVSGGDLGSALGALEIRSGIERDEFWAVVAPTAAQPAAGAVLGLQVRGREDEDLLAQEVSRMPPGRPQAFRLQLPVRDPAELLRIFVVHVADFRVHVLQRRMFRAMIPPADRTRPP